jgi:hypothetical protein
MVYRALTPYLVLLNLPLRLDCLWSELLFLDWTSSHRAASPNGLGIRQVNNR